jgi:hypothetical protein
VSKRSPTRSGPSSGARGEHRRCPITVIFTELDCHGRCLECGVLGPGRPTSEAARQALMVPELTQRSARY